jgi:hypothetical protein
MPATGVCAGACIAPPGGCSCVANMCTFGILTQGSACDPQHDACGIALKCCSPCATPNCAAQPVCLQGVNNGTGTFVCPALP